MNLIDNGEILDRAICQGYGSMYVIDLLPDPREIDHMLSEDPAYEEWDKSLEEDSPEEDVPL